MLDVATFNTLYSLPMADTQMQVHSIPLEDIAVINRQRRILDPKKVEELAASIAESGLLHPIVVRDPHPGEEVGTCKYVLVVGGRRYASHLLLGKTHINATHKEAMDPLAAEVAELNENLMRDSISWQDEVEAKARIHMLRTKQDPFQTLTATAEELDVDKAEMSRDIKLARLIQQDPELLKATSKAGAHRQAAFKKNAEIKLRNVSAADQTSLRELMVTSDWLTFAKTIEDASVDLVLSDLPYGIDQFENQQGGGNHISKFDDSADTVLPDIAALVPELVRVVKPNGWICLFMSYEHHAWLMEQFSKLGLRPEMPPWIWNRAGSPGSFGHYPELHAANRFEVIVVVNRGEAKLLKKPVENVLSYEALNRFEKAHNHQKPQDLLQELLSRFTVPGELVVDFCFGSGAHLAAAASMGRRFMGCEKNPVMLDAAIGLVAEHMQPIQLGGGSGAKAET